jgi:hypothetical protein
MRQHQAKQHIGKGAELEGGVTAVVKRTSAASGHKPCSNGATSPVIKLAGWKRPLITIDMNGMVFAMKANTMPAVASARERWRELAENAPQRRAAAATLSARFGRRKAERVTRPAHGTRIGAFRDRLVRLDTAASRMPSGPAFKGADKLND